MPNSSHPISGSAAPKTVIALTNQECGSTLVVHMIAAHHVGWDSASRKSEERFDNNANTLFTIRPRLFVISRACDILLHY